MPQIIDMRTRLGYSVSDKFKVYPEDLHAFRALDSRELSGLAKMSMETGLADNFLGAIVGGSLAARQSIGVGQAKVPEVQVRGIPKGPKLASEGVHAPARQAISAGAAKARQAMSAGAGAVKGFVRKITGGAADQVGKPAAVTIQIKPVEAIPDSYVARWRQGDVQGGMSFKVNSTDNSVSIDGIARGEQMPPRSAGSNAAAALKQHGMPRPKSIKMHNVREDSTLRALRAGQPAQGTRLGNTLENMARELGGTVTSTEVVREGNEFHIIAHIEY